MEEGLRKTEEAEKNSAKALATLRPFSFHKSWLEDFFICF